MKQHRRTIMSKPSCELCGAPLVEGECAVICGRCARPIDDQQKEIDGLAKEKDGLEDELASKQMTVSLICQTCGRHLDAIADCPYCHIFPEQDELAALRAENERLEKDRAFQQHGWQETLARERQHLARIGSLEAALRRMPCRNCGISVGGFVDIPDKAIVAAEFCPDCALRRFAAAALKGDAE